MNIKDHPSRLSAANELHARPFPPVEVPCIAVFLALMSEHAPVARDRARDREDLWALLSHYGAPLPDDDARHYFAAVGRGKLKWECHTEMVTYTAFLPLPEDDFDPRSFDFFPSDWLASVQGRRLTSALVRIAPRNGEEADTACCARWFVSESLAMSNVVDGNATLAGDFRFDPAGHMRFALFTAPEAGPRRIGRIVQRITEVETYKSAAMLGFLETAELDTRLAELEEELTAAVGTMRAEGQSERALDRLLTIASELEDAATRSSFRFGATGAYADLVAQRIEILREERIASRQSFAEFMARRFNPAMRTVAARKARLEELSARASHAAELLRTKVDVARSAQNQALLASMDRRADLQLRLQKTVEGLSVVAISYYAVNLSGYLLAPFWPWSKTALSGFLVIPVILAVWALVRRIRLRMG